MESYWQNHTMFYLIVLALFPRLALLFCSFPSSLLFWVGWFCIPRITIAVLATMFYLSSNPILVVLSWLIALSGESAEKKYTYKYTKKKTKKIDCEIIDE